MQTTRFLAFVVSLVPLAAAAGPRPTGFGSAAFASFPLAGPPEILEPAPWRSGSALVLDEPGSRLWAADADRGTLATIDAAAGRITAETAVGAEPEQLVLGVDGSVFATVRRAGKVVKVGPAGVLAEARLGGEPWGIARSDDGSTVFVTLATADAVVALEAATLAVRWRRPVAEAPRAIAWLPSAEVAVGHLRGRDLTVLAAEDGAPREALVLATRPNCGGGGLDLGRMPVNNVNFDQKIELGDDVVVGNVFGAEAPVQAPPPQVPPKTLPPDFQGLFGTSPNSAPNLGAASAAPSACEAVRAHAMVSAGDQLFVFHEDANPGMNGRPSGGYGGSQRDLPIIPRMSSFRIGPGRPGSGKRLGSPFVEVQPAGIAGAALVAPSRSLLLASRGADLVGLVTHDTAPSTSFAGTAVEGGPAAVAVNRAGTRAWVLSAFGREVRAFDLRLKDERSFTFGTAEATAWRVSAAATPPVALAESPLDADVRLGRRLFHKADPRVSTAGFACASCHPDGRQDGLTWSLEGGRRQTPMLAGRLAGTAPYNWEGSEQSLEGNIRQTVRRLRGLQGPNALKDPEVKAIAAYLMSLEGPVNPRRDVDDAHQALVARGREVFEGPVAACAGCHVAARAFTDGDRHDVGTVSEVEKRGLQAFRGKAVGLVDLDTPSLKDLALTGPWLHDGSATTLDEVLTKTNGEMGDTAKLSTEERSALLAYLETL